jgi:hypothetical protein
VDTQSDNYLGKQSFRGVKVHMEVMGKREVLEYAFQRNTMKTIYRSVNFLLVILKEK